MKKLKLFIKILVVIFVLLLIAAVIFVNSFNTRWFKDELAKQVKTATGFELQIDNIDVKLSLSPYLKVTNLALSNPQYQKSLLTVDEAAISIAVFPLLYKNIVIREFYLNSPVVNLSIDKYGNSNWILENNKNKIISNKNHPVNTIPSASFSKSAVVADDNHSLAESSSSSNYVFDIGKVSGENIQIIYNDELNNQYHKLFFSSFAGEPKNDKLKLDIQANYNNIPISLNGLVSRVIDTLKFKKTNLDIQALIVDNKFDIVGEFNLDFSDFNLDVHGQLPNLASTLAKINQDIPKLPKIIFDANVYGSKDNFNLNLSKLNLGDSQITATSSVALAPKLSVDFNINSSLLSLDDFLIDEKIVENDKNVISQNSPSSIQYQSKSKSDAYAQSQSSKSEQKLFSSEPLPISALTNDKIMGTINIQKLVWSAFDNNINTSVYSTINMNNNKLSLSLKTKTDVGNSDVSLNLMNINNKLLNLDVSVVSNIPTLAVFFPQTNSVQGIPLDINIKANSVGASVAEIMANLNGNIFLKAQKGMIKQDVLSFMGEDIFMQALTSVIPKDKQDYDIEFVCGAANIDINNGFVSLKRNFAIQTDKFNVVTLGDINLKNEALSLQLDFTSTQGLQVGLSSLLSSLFEIQGTLANPRVGIGLDQAANTAVKVGAAILTSGISLVGEKVTDMVLQDNNPCQTAFNKGLPLNDNSNTSSSSKSSLSIDEITNTTKKTIDSSLEAGKDTAKKVLNGMKSLFK